MKFIKLHDIIIPPVFLAPMCGVSDLPFRNAVHSLASNALTFTEMIASHAVLRDIKRMKHKTNKNSNQILAVQLAGCEPDIVAEAANINVGIGADIIDINFGCPVKKVVKSFAGSALMKDEELAVRIVDKVVRKVNVPVTVKMRLGWDNDHLNAVSLAKKLEDIGVKMITVHGRTRTQMFDGKANWSLVGEVKDAVKIPVIVNGDIKNYEDAMCALNESHCDGVMIGRGAYGRPWLIAELIHQICNGPICQLTSDQKMNIIVQHMNDIITLHGCENAIGFMRKHLGFYSANMPNSAAVRHKINQLVDVDEMIKTFESLYYSNALTNNDTKV